MYLKDKLDNGIRVVMEKISYVNSVSIGILINNGNKRGQAFKWRFSFYRTHAF